MLLKIITIQKILSIVGLIKIKILKITWRYNKKEILYKKKKKFIQTFLYPIFITTKI